MEILRTRELRRAEADRAAYIRDLFARLAAYFARPALIRRA